jgi:AraC family transcriptional regulator, regulatory protein of adaptative response / methylated-DNA-[protein]-cysteine methyltransferase
MACASPRPTDISPQPRGISSDADRWDAVRQRERTADGLFYYSVRSTGVYCRPSCAARLPRRENVAFHETCAAAERAGFRACKRCRPNEALRAQRAVVSANRPGERGKP